MALDLRDDIYEGGRLAILMILGAVLVMGIGYALNIVQLKGTEFAALIGFTLAGILPKNILPEAIRPRFSRETIGAPFFAGVFLVLVAYIAPMVLGTIPGAQPVTQAMTFTAQAAEAAAEEVAGGMDLATFIIEVFLATGGAYWVLFVGTTVEELQR